MNEEKVTHSAGVPTVWLAMFQHMDATGQKPEFCELVTIGGSAAPRAMIERLMKMGIRVGHAWGMTETSPIGTMGAPPPNWDELSFEEKLDQVCKQGRVPFGVELRVVDDEDRRTAARRRQFGPAAGAAAPGSSSAISRPMRRCVDADGWFDTGDVAVLHPCGTMQITDRSKDVIKSGGEWISSVDLENAAVGCPGVQEAAIGIYHPRWDERPLLLIIRKPGATVSAEDIHAYLATRVAKWWLPDEILFVDSLPHTATGKLLKTALREQFRDHKLAAVTGWIAPGNPRSCRVHDRPDTRRPQVGGGGGDAMDHSLL
jgi:fatty-acyl-CoA synthase